MPSIHTEYNAEHLQFRHRTEHIHHRKPYNAAPYVMIKRRFHVADADQTGLKRHHKQMKKKNGHKSCK